MGKEVKAQEVVVNRQGSPGAKGLILPAVAPQGLSCCIDVNILYGHQAKVAGCVYDRMREKLDWERKGSA
jgi:hypothetical protein